MSEREYGYASWLNDDDPTPAPSPAVVPPPAKPEDAAPVATNIDELVEVTPVADADAEELLLDVPDADAAPIATLPESLAARSQDTSLKPRFKGHSPLNNMVRQDWIKLIQIHPDNFDALLFRPDPLDVGDVDDDTGIEGPSFTELNNNQRDLSYSEPEAVKVLDCPDERESFEAVDADGEQDGLSDEIQVLRIAAQGVSVGSILTWNEEMASGALAQRWWYVHRIFSLGTQHVGSLYYCIPARNLDSTAGGKVQ